MCTRGHVVARPLMPSVADLIVEGLRRAGIPRLYVMGRDGAPVQLLQAARDQGLGVVVCERETAAVVMAAVSGELAGRPGAVAVRSGPQVAASVPGLAHAMCDRAPVILLSARDSREQPDASAKPDPDARVAAEDAARLAAVVKASVTLAADSASHWLAHAAQLALKEPRGPVHLDVPTDILSESTLPLAANPRPGVPPAPDVELLDRAAAMIRAARRPIVVAGLERRAPDTAWLRAFCEAVPAPTLATAKGKGALPDPHPLAMGLLTGGVRDEPLMRRADLVIAFGVDAAEIGPRPWRYTAPVLRLARCPLVELRASTVGGVPPALEVIGDLATILEELAPRVVGGDARADWDVAEIDRLRRERHTALEVATAGLAPHRVIQLAREITPAGTIASIDPGRHRAPALAHWHAVEPGECLVSNGLGFEGFAVPAAIAAQSAHPDRRVLCFTGIRGLLLAAPDLAIAADLGLPITIVAFRDDVGPGGSGVDVRGLSLALGLAAEAVEDEAGFVRAFARASAVPGPCLIDSRVDAAGYRDD